MQFKGVCDYTVPWKIFRIICGRKHEQFTRKTDNQLVARNNDIRSRVNNKLVLPWYSNSKCHHSLIFRRIKLLNITPIDITQSNNLAKFKIYLKCFFFTELIRKLWLTSSIVFESHQKISNEDVNLVSYVPAIKFYYSVLIKMLAHKNLSFNLN